MNVLFLLCNMIHTHTHSDSLTYDEKCSWFESFRFFLSSSAALFDADPDNQQQAHDSKSLMSLNDQLLSSLAQRLSFCVFLLLLFVLCWNWACNRSVSVSPPNKMPSMPANCTDNRWPYFVRQSLSEIHIIYISFVSTLPKTI